MRPIIQTGIVSIVVAMTLSGCQQKPTDPAAGTGAAPAATAAQGAWPASLPAFGDGFPNAGDPCRRVGESAATANFLDHTAALVGCLSAADAAKLGGRVVATVDGVTLVSVPNAAAAMPGGGDGQGDAKGAGTP
jgi:hypothetical protein